MKTLTIRWQRLVNESGQTCTRCEETGDTVKTAFDKLKKTLGELDIEVELEKETLDFSQISNSAFELPIKTICNDVKLLKKRTFFALQKQASFS